MAEMKFATGTWIYGTVGDRYLLDGYRRGIDIVERIKKISDIDGISGIEMIYPADFDPGIDTIGELISLADLECCVVGADLTGDPKWRYGSFASKDPVVRREAVELTKQTVDAAATIGADRINLWPGEDGHDYPFQVDYTKSWESFVECTREVASYRPEIKVCLEYKFREPRVRSLVSTVGKSALMCREIGMENVGVTIDVGHSLQAGENVAESIAMLHREGRLFHVHLNDNYRGWDDDMVLGSIHTVEFLEMAYMLRTLGYEGWLSIDVYPYREDPAAVVAESVAFMRGLDGLLDRLGIENIGRTLEEDDPLQLLAEIRRATLG